ncbi:MAG: hypothetical protein K9G59_12700 [Caulobacter sp.]|nr:hypothetical protein [Caulobacter sp.]
MTIIRDWTPDKAHAFGKEVLTFDHDLHNRPMFDDDGLADLLDRYPRDRLGVFTMGQDPREWRTWRRGVAGNLPGQTLLRMAREGRIWLNLRAVNDHLPEYDALAGEVFAEKEAMVPGLRTMKRDLGVLISSPNAQVFYHLDVPLVSLWQIRGVKTVWAYPVADPFVGPEALEAIVLRETAEQFAFDPAWDAGAAKVQLTPGRMLTWPQNAPHRIENGPMLNVSLSMEYMTPAALMRANVIYANGLLRRRLGVDPKVQPGFSALGLTKVAVARAAKALKLQKANERVLPVTFNLETEVPGIHGRQAA